MLYKNLPEEELKPVMRVRTFLDYCAAAVWVLKGDFANAKGCVECPSGVLPDSQPVYCRPSTKPGPYSIEDHSRTLFLQFGVAGKSKGPKNFSALSH